MSRENVERVREGYEAFARGDLAWFVEELVDEEVDWYPAIGPLVGVETIRGRQATARFFREEISEGLAGFTAEAVSIEDLGGECVLVRSRYTGTGRESGAPVILDTYALVRLKEGKVVAFRDYKTRTEALAAASSSE